MGCGLVAPSLYRPAVTSAYVARLPEAAALERLGLRPVNDAGKVYLLIPDDEGVFLETPDHQRPAARQRRSNLSRDLQKTGLRGPDQANALRHWKGLSAMKYETYREYNPDGVATAEGAFLTVWAGLGSWHSDLVLVGGLVPKYLCGDLSATRTLPRPVTLDADLGIALGATLGQYGSLK